MTNIDEILKNYEMRLANIEIVLVTLLRILKNNNIVGDELLRTEILRTRNDINFNDSFPNIYLN